MTTTDAQVTDDKGNVAMCRTAQLGAYADLSLSEASGLLDEIDAGLRARGIEADAETLYHVAHRFADVCHAMLLPEFLDSLSMVAA